MRFDGVIKTWDDVRGVGTIEPLPDGDEIAVHITAFGRGQVRPRARLRVSFEVELAHDGSKRAKAVQIHEGVRSPRAQSRAARSTASSIPSLVLIALFMAGYAAATYFWKLSPAMGITFVALGLLSFAAVAQDRTAARARRRRLPDGLWLALALVGGWAGLLLAPPLLGHSPGRRLSPALMRLAVATHILVFFFFASPFGRDWR